MLQRGKLLEYLIYFFCAFLLLVNLDLSNPAYLGSPELKFLPLQAHDNARGLLHSQQMTQERKASSQLSVVLFSLKSSLLKSYCFDCPLGQRWGLHCLPSAEGRLCSDWSVPKPVHLIIIKTLTEGHTPEAVTTMV